MQFVQVNVYRYWNQFTTEPCTINLAFVRSIKPAVRFDYSNVVVIPDEYDEEGLPKRTDPRPVPCTVLDLTDDASIEVDADYATFIQMISPLPVCITRGSVPV
jgi:hypothetical protein